MTHNKLNVCGILISVEPHHLSNLIAELNNIKGCTICEHTEIKIAAVIEDTPEKKAIDIIDIIKDNPLCLHVDLVNHYFE